MIHRTLHVKSHGVSGLYFTWQPYPVSQGIPVLATLQHKTQSAEEYESLNTLAAWCEKQGLTLSLPRSLLLFFP